MSDERDLGGIARRIVDANSYMMLGTADGSGVPWVSPVWFAHADYRQFLWVSRPESRHSRNLANRPELAIVIFDSHRAGGWQSIYMSAEAEELEAAEVEEGIRIFSRRSREQGLPDRGAEDVRAPASFRFYRATVSELFVLDPHDQRIPVDLP